MYADVVTASMAHAIDETTRRRERQVAYNIDHGIDPTPLRKKIADITDQLAREGADTAELLASRRAGGKKSPTPALRREGRGAEGAAELESIIGDLTEQMLTAAAELKFELAARLRDEVHDLKKDLRGMIDAGHVR
jgi:excinuclease ABC subunit B